MIHENPQTARECVENGVELLDQHIPDWRDNIDVDTLVIHNPGACVLTQLYDDWDLGKSALGIQYPATADHGFDRHYEDNPIERYTALQIEWERVLIDA